MKDYKIGKVVSKSWQTIVRYKEDDVTMIANPSKSIKLYDEDRVLGFVNRMTGEFETVCRIPKQIVDPVLVARVACKFINEVPEVLLNKYYDRISIYDLDRKSRLRNIVVARQLAQFLYILISGKSTTRTGQLYGKKDHSTVVYSIKIMLNEMSSNKEFTEYMPELVNQIINPDKAEDDGIKQHLFNTCQQ